MFNITAGKGFHITFDNGFTVSVQWGSGNYGDNYLNFKDPAPASTTAELAAWGPNGDMLCIGATADTVLGYLTADQVLTAMNIVQGWCPVAIAGQSQVLLPVK
jgi:hypothetical protein